MKLKLKSFLAAALCAVGLSAFAEPPIAAESDEFAVDLRPEVALAAGETTVPVVAWSATAWGAAPASASTDVGWTNAVGKTGLIAAGLSGEGQGGFVLPKKDGSYRLTHSAGDLASFVTFVVSGYPVGSSQEDPWYVGTPDPEDAAVWFDYALTNVAPLAADVGLPGATNAVDLVALTNGMAKSGYVPLLPLDALVLIGDGAFVQPAMWIGESGFVYKTLEEALVAAETKVTPSFGDEGETMPPKAVVEEVEVEVEPGVTNVVTATVKNGGGDVDGAIQTTGVEGLAELAAAIKTNIVLDVTAKGTMASADELIGAATQALDGRTTTGTPETHYVDITLTSVADDGTSDKLHELDEPLAITIPWTFAPHRRYQLARYHDVTAMAFATTPDANGEYVEFDRDGGRIVVHTMFFSDYAVVDFQLPNVWVTVPAAGSLPEGVDSVTVTTNGVPVASTTDDGVSVYVIDVGVPVEVVATAADGYGFVSEDGSDVKTLFSGTPDYDVTVTEADLEVESNGLKRFRYELLNYTGVANGSAHAISIKVFDPPADLVVQYSEDGGATWDTVLPLYQDLGTYANLCRLTAEGYATVTKRATVTLIDRSELGDGVTATTPEPVAYKWLEELGVVAPGATAAEYEAAAMRQSGFACRIGGAEVGSYANWEAALLGLDSSCSNFVISIDAACEPLVKVTWSPDLSGDNRVYQVYACTDLAARNWQPLARDADGYVDVSALPEGSGRFFKVAVTADNVLGSILQSARNVGFTGDVNQDGGVNQLDFDLLQAHVVNDLYRKLGMSYKQASILTGAMFKSADVNGDGVVDSRDLALLKTMVR